MHTLGNRPVMGQGPKHKHMAIQAKAHGSNSKQKYESSTRHNLDPGIHWESEFMTGFTVVVYGNHDTNVV